MPRAIGLINIGRGTDHRRDEQAIHDLVHERGYSFAGLLTITENTYMPTTLVAYTAFIKGATVVVAPSLSHFAGTAEAISRVITVDTPTATLSRNT